MNPSPEAVAAVRAQVSDWSASDAAIASSLNAPAVANPVPRPTVPKPFTVADVFGSVSAASLANLTRVAFLPDVRDTIISNNVASCVLYANLLLAGAVLSQADHDAVVAVVTATEPDPSWQPQISWAVATLGRAVDPSDVAASRPGA